MNEFYDLNMRHVFSPDDMGEETEYIPIISAGDEDDMLKLNVPDVVPADLDRTRSLAETYS
jgi:hypothetical protein